MAKDILQSEAAAMPPLDTVLLWLSATVERDFEVRGVFPDMRRARALAFRGASTLHFLTLPEAEAVLVDARARADSARGPVLKAINAHAMTVRAAMKEATARPKEFEFPELRKHSESHWVGTKEQLLAKGLKLDGPWPTEPGGPLLWANAKDWRGYRATVTRYSSIWPGPFKVRVSIPWDDLEGIKRRERLAELEQELFGATEAALGVTSRRGPIDFSPRPGDALWDRLMEDTLPDASALKTASELLSRFGA